MFIQKRRVFADDEILVDDAPAMENEGMEDGSVVVEPEASDLLFEAEDVAELVAEVTGAPVDVSVEDDSVTFAVGEEEFTVEAEGDEEVLEACSKRQLSGKRRVSAATNRVAKRSTARRAAARPVKASTKAGRRVKTIRPSAK